MNDDLPDRVKKYGEHWRYIWMLERELEVRKTRQVFLWSLLGLSVVQFGAIVYLLVGP
ncbi:hypothetical protein [Mesorhizobium sp. B2-1-3A]|uniref:hypothetical protein n=1 Tax=Mesorhizobium sp. B2-1-3A TaxID=2589971 RepID=UPI0015E3E7F8|nr:hypothetical protein [Mesorhizobium sp. B2-1-3A]